MSTNTRKLRRNRVDAAASNDDVSANAAELYNIQGNAAAALEQYAERCKETPKSNSAQYNHLLLSQLRNCCNMTNNEESKTSDNDSGVANHQKKIANNFIKTLEEYEKKSANNAKDQVLSARKVQRNDYIMAYNRALLNFTSGQYQDCLDICLDKIKKLITEREKPADESLTPASRMALLIVDCLMQKPLQGTEKHQDIPKVGAILSWLNTLDCKKDPQLKFLLALYRSRADLSIRDTQSKHVESKIRSARKDLKTAMEVLQHKLRPYFGVDDAMSVASSQNSLEENMSTATSQNNVTTEYQQQLPSSTILQKHNQAALNLKANLEQLKGNTKKSLILCSEALGAATTDSTYEGVHANNLGIVYGASNKTHLALHAFAQGLQTTAANSASAAMFHADGTAKLDQTLSTLYNAGLGALQARNYKSSYECLATCVSRSEFFFENTKCWIRMAEACLGVYSSLEPNKSNACAAPIQFDGDTLGFVLEHDLCTDHTEPKLEELVTEIGSKEDMEQVATNPLLRGRSCAQHVLDKDKDNELSTHDKASVQLIVSFIDLCFREYDTALEAAKAAIDTLNATGKLTDEISIACNKRLHGTARVYAAEAACALGDSSNALKYLFGKGKDNTAFDKLASDLSGVTLSAAASNGCGKRRLTKSQVMVRSSASVISSIMGNFTAAKQLAMSAQSMEDAYATNRERSSARRALLYCLLRDGKYDAALTLLRSMRQV